MQKWATWGDGTREVPLPHRLPALLRKELGPSHSPQDKDLAHVAAGVPTSRLSSRAGPPGKVSQDPVARLLHARGQSFPDLLATRSGDVGAVPDAVAWPADGAEVRELLVWAATNRSLVVPWGGGTSVVGGVTCPESDRPVVVVDLARLTGVRDVDRTSSLATLGAGTLGPAVENELATHGLTLGHRPQSFEHSTVGGWVATRSSGQQSLGYGRIEDVFAGGHVETPEGPLELPPFPASASGPDLRQVVLGSEGRLGVVTEAVLRVRRLPEQDTVLAGFLPTWSAGLAAVQELALEAEGLSMLRLSTPAETAVTFRLAGQAGSVLAGGLRLARLGAEPCLLLAGLTGSTRSARQAGARVRALLRRHGGRTVGTGLGRRWQRSRYDSPYWRAHLWELGYGVDTVETAATWTKLPGLVAELESSMAYAAEQSGARAHIGTHVSHVYRSGGSVYTTVVFPLASSAAQTLHRWRAVKSASLAAIARSGGTLSHQHGVGRDHRPALSGEKGSVGLTLIEGLVRTVDPGRILNPGVLVP